MKIKDIIDYLDQVAPPLIQEDYDNSGLQLGDKEWEATGVLCCLDSTEAVVEEAVKKGCNLILAHHPLLFSGIKRIGAEQHVERTIIRAIKNDIAIFAVHTNLDKVLRNGVNEVIAQRLGLDEITPLKTTDKMISFSLYSDKRSADDLVNHLKEICKNVYSAPASSGMARIHGSFSTLVRKSFQRFVNQYDLDIADVEFAGSQNTDLSLGLGLIGHLSKAMEEGSFLDMVKERMETECIRHSPFTGNLVRKVAVCGGSGSFLISNAIAFGAEAYITSDLKYHDFFEADGKLMLCDIGHYESEQFTIALIHRLIKEKFTNFAAYLTEVNSNPVNYK